MTGLTIRPTPKQREAHQALQSNSVVLYGGAIRGGKSYWLLLELLTLAFKYDNSRWLILRASYTNISRTILVSFREMMGKGFDQYLKKWDGQTMTATFMNGSQIMFMAESFDGDKELNKFRGLEINGAGIDEINEIQEQTFNKVIERSGSWNGAGVVPIKIICTCNPTHGWVKSRFYDKWEANKLPEGWRYIPAKLTDNPFLSPDYVQSLQKNMPEYEYKVFVEGRWDVKLEGLLFDDNEFKRFKLNEIQGDADSVLGYIDVADEGNDNLCFILGKIYKNKVFITDVVFTNQNVDITLPLCAGLISKEKADFVRVETNNQGSVFIKMLRDKLSPERILGVKNTTNKVTRVLMQYAFIKEYFYFRDDYDKGSEYDLFMKQILSFRKDGNNKHDDAPDALAGLSKFIQTMLPDNFNR